MEVTERPDFLICLYLASKQLREGVEAYVRIRQRVATGDFDGLDPDEQTAVKIFNARIEKKGLGTQMLDLASKLHDLYEHVSDVCKGDNADILDFEFNEAEMKFIDLLEQWAPLSKACEKLGAEMTRRGLHKKL